jgi:GT2 family glycosyltransferase
MIVPTLGSRPSLLRECLESIAMQASAADIVVVAPAGNDAVVALATEFGAALVDDPGSLADAINLGAQCAQDHHEYLNWLGDDDLLEPGSLAATVAALDADPSAVLAYGACRYIDEQGRELWISRAGKWAPRILSWGPDLIPQPGMLVRASAWRAVGGVDGSYRFAFDLDLLLKLRRQGGLIDVGRVVSSFRWHPDSLTVSDRTASLEESERARRQSLAPGARRVAWLWERPVRWATRAAAAEVSRRARRLEHSRPPSIPHHSTSPDHPHP